MATGAITFLGLEPLVYSQPLWLGSAVEQMETLDPAQLQILTAAGQAVFAPEQAVAWQQLLAGYSQQQNEGHREAARTTQIKIAALIRSTDITTWSKMVQEIEYRLRDSGLPRFASAAQAVTQAREALGVEEPEQVAKMSDNDKVKLAMELFRWYRTTVARLISEVHDLRENDIDGLKNLYERLAADFRRLHNLPLQPSDPVLSSLVADLKSSVGQLPANLRSVMENDMERFQLGIIDWEVVLEDISRQLDPREKQILGGHGFRYLASQSELAHALIFWLKTDALTQKWTEGKWQISRPAKSEKQSIQIRAFKHAHWPPDPEGDIILRTYLELLGWKMTVESDKTRVIVTVDFGEQEF